MKLGPHRKRPLYRIYENGQLLEDESQSHSKPIAGRLRRNLPTLRRFATAAMLACVSGLIVSAVLFRGRAADEPTSASSTHVSAPAPGSGEGVKLALPSTSSDHQPEHRVAVPGSARGSRVPSARRRPEPGRRRVDRSRRAAGIAARGAARATVMSSESAPAPVSVPVPASGAPSVTGAVDSRTACPSLGHARAELGFER